MLGSFGWEAQMFPNSVVQDLEVAHHGTIYRATYFIESGVIHANLVGRLQSTVCWGAKPEDTVRALLHERIVELSTSYERR
jgi:hypothetical protein